MTKKILLIVLLIVFLPLIFFTLAYKLSPRPTVAPSPSPEVQGINEATSSGILVTRVVDGDTIEIETGEKVRLIGVDTPETVDPKRPVGCFGKEASNETKSLLTNKRVVLEKDVQDKDKYGRLLRYVYLPLENGQMLFIDDFLIREGYGKVLIIPPDGKKYENQFYSAQNDARANKRGLWGSC